MDLMDISPVSAGPDSTSTEDHDSQTYTNNDQQNQPSPPSSLYLQATWRDLVQKYMDLHLYDSARFYAERAWYDLPCQDHAYQLAQVYYKQGKIKQCYLILQDSKVGDHSASKYLLALCCVSLQKLEEAESILAPKQRFAPVQEDFVLSEEMLASIPGGSAGLFLLGKVCRRQQRHSLAKVYFKYALQMDPFLWTAVTELCDLGMEDSLRDYLGQFFQNRYPEPTPSSAAEANASADYYDENFDLNQHGHYSAGQDQATNISDSQAKNKQVDLSSMSMPYSAQKPVVQSQQKQAQQQSQSKLADTTNQFSASKDYSIQWSVQPSMEYSGIQQHTPVSQMASFNHNNNISSGHDQYNYNSQFSHSRSQYSQLNAHSLEMSQLTPIAVSSAAVVRRLLGDESVEYSAEKASRLALSALSKLSQPHSHHHPRSYIPASAPTSAEPTPAAALAPTTAVSSTPLSAAATTPMTMAQSMLLQSSSGASHPQQSSQPLGSTNITMMTPSGIVATEISALSLQIPFQTPGSMPFSPITRSMLDDELYHNQQQSLLQDPTTLQRNTYSNSHHYNASFSINNSNISFSTIHSNKLNRTNTHNNTSLGFELGLSRIGESGLEADDDPNHHSDSHPSMSNGHSYGGVNDTTLSQVSTLAPLRSTLFGLPTPEGHQPSTNNNNDQGHIVGGGRRRVSFGPSTRLSFSEAALPMPDLHHHHHNNNNNQQQNATQAQSTEPGSASSSVSASTNKVVTAGGDNDGERQPSKLLRSSDPATVDAPLAQHNNTSQPNHTNQTKAQINNAHLQQRHVRNVYRQQPQHSSNLSAHSLYLAHHYILTQIVAIFAEAYQHVTHYQGLECITLLQTQLPARHFDSGLACQYLGRAYIDMNEYTAAIVAFKAMLRQEPFRLSGVELLSSALWHQRKEHELASLAQQVVDIDRLAAETWCVLGNCASLQKEAETALRFFQRAIQVDPSFTYAYTLSGHEFVANEDMEKAIASFRTALLCNMRHYNAWYGLGSIYYRQERYELAEYHFRQARDINRRSSVLDCYLGMALNAQGTSQKVREALTVLEEASKRFENNPQLRFQRAHILMTQEHWQEALQELLLVEKHAPKEPSVHALLGQLYQRLGDVQLSLLHLNIALDLDPKEANSIKAIMDNFEDFEIAI